MIVVFRFIEYELYKTILYKTNYQILFTIYKNATFATQIAFKFLS